jgi:hypothetical protein
MVCQVLGGDEKSARSAPTAWAPLPKCRARSSQIRHSTQIRADALMDSNNAGSDVWKRPGVRLLG